jgi:lysozyme family protein
LRDALADSFEGHFNFCSAVASEQPKRVVAAIFDPPQPDEATKALTCDVECAHPDVSGMGRQKRLSNMNTNFASALRLVLTDEGGFVNDPMDPGGATNFGVTLSTYRALMKPGATVADLKHITQDELATIYRKDYWNAICGDQLPSGLDYACFDYAVNSGPGRSAKALQSLIGVTVDGSIGPKTLAAVKSRDTATLVRQLCNSRLIFLETLPTWGHFGKGWAARVARVEAAALKMVTT